MIGKIGQIVTYRFSTLVGMIGLFVLIVRKVHYLRYPTRFKLFVLLSKRHIFNVGFKSAYIITIIGFVIVWAILSRIYSFIPAGSSLIDFYSSLFVATVIRELGPIIVGFILIARSASAITAEIGYLKLNNEFEVLYSLNMHTAFVLFLPVLFAFPISLLILTIYFDVISLYASYIFVFFFFDSDVRLFEFINQTLTYVSVLDINIIILKAIIGGGGIAIISLYFGSQVGDRFTDISRAISRANTVQVLFFFVFNILLSVWAY